MHDGAGVAGTGTLGPAGAVEDFRLHLKATG